MAYRDKTYRICQDALMLGLSLIFSYLEAILPLTFWLPLPGFKLGLCNIIITMVFVCISPLDAAIISFSRILLMGVLFGNVTSFIFSLCGGLLSYVGLWLLVRIGERIFSTVGVSVGCALLHNIGQLLAASFLFGADAIFGYLPFLLISALLFGTITGILLQILLPRFRKLSTLWNQQNIK